MESTFHRVFKREIEEKSGGTARLVEVTDDKKPSKMTPEAQERTEAELKAQFGHNERSRLEF